MRLSWGLAVMATALLVVGLLADDGLAPIVLSILGSVVAGAMLLRVSLRRRSEGPPGLSG